MNDEIFSVLKMNSIVVDKLLFSRKSFRSTTEKEEKFSFSTEQEELESCWRISLSIKVERVDEFVAEVHMSAFVEIEDETEGKDLLLTKNTVAILFPYARAQMTLLTSQPETIPVVLPAMNINALIDSIERDKGNH